jgi:hypothetical protein
MSGGVGEGHGCARTRHQGEDWSTQVEGARALQPLPRSEAKWSKVEAVCLQGEAELAKAKAIEVKAASAALGEADQGEISELQKRRAEIEEKTSVAVQDGFLEKYKDSQRTGSKGTRLFGAARQPREKTGNHEPDSKPMSSAEQEESDFWAEVLAEASSITFVSSPSA